MPIENIQTKLSTPPESDYSIQSTYTGLPISYVTIILANISNIPNGFLNNKLEKLFTKSSLEQPSFKKIEMIKFDLLKPDHLNLDLKLDLDLTNCYIATPPSILQRLSNCFCCCFRR